ncbi:guanylate kinase [Novosphingobium beihaiensis]|uniref:Guanylate kinase n=1 Tax=Novosphingobium beihaiensis TaxID=2930389 RepID=A0ABT0BP60_9SPHN|nr:guanylate kinase [Novosphingobium beihaiensis]MCJ2186616.1 guanylate kinase [Novosphingobium beihaiensis]
MPKSAHSPALSSEPAGPLARRGLMFILSSPSGGGKTTISRMLLEQDPDVCISVSVTTRAPRPGEVDGTHYHFVSQAEFDRMVENEELLEWARVFDHCYGTPKAQVKAGLKNGQDYLFDIDWQGTQQLYQKLERDVVRVFLLPPSIEELRRRLTGRGTDSAEIIAGRMERARSEISHWDGYDYVVVNDDMQTCYKKVTEILEAERMRRARQTGLIGFVRELMQPEG